MNRAALRLIHAEHIRDGLDCNCLYYLDNTDEFIQEAARRNRAYKLRRGSTVLTPTLPTSFR